MNKKLLIGSIIAVVILVLVSSSSAIDIKTEEDTGCGSLEITDISFEGLKIIATIKSIGMDIRTMSVDFYKSRIIGGNPTDPILIGGKLSGIHAGETIHVTKRWLGFGHYIIQVKTPKLAEASQEVWWFLLFGWEVN